MLMWYLFPVWESELRRCFTLCLFIILLVRFGLLSVHLLENSCTLGWPYVRVVYLQVLFISHFVFRAGFGFGLLQFLFNAFLLL